MLEFVDEHEIDPLFVDKSYYSAPDSLEKKSRKKTKGNSSSNVQEKAYSLLARVLHDTKKAAIGKVVLRGEKEHLVAIRAYQRGLIMHTLHYLSEMRHPFRLYANNGGTICVLVCEAPILVQGIHRVLNAIMKWVLDSKVRNVIVLEGMPMQGIPESKRYPFVLSNSEEDHTLIDNLNDWFASTKIRTKNHGRKEEVETLSDYENSKETLGPTYIGGVSGGLLSSCISNNIRCTAILVPSLSGIPDPEGAAIVLEALASITHHRDLKIDVKQLRRQGNQVRKNLEKIATSIRNNQKSMNVNETLQGGENVMYG